jgi:hypothetical protein
MSEPLRPMVEERIAAGGADAETLASLIAESLVDLILMVPEAEQTKLLAHTVSALGDLFLQKSGAEDGGKHPVRTAVERGGRSMLRSRREVGLSGVPVPGK